MTIWERLEYNNEIKINGYKIIVSEMPEIAWAHKYLFLGDIINDLQ